MPTPFLQAAPDGRYKTERNDCCVTALALVTGAPYIEVHGLLESRGIRAYGRYTPWKRYFPLLDSGTVLGASLHRLDWVDKASRITLGRFARENPVGSYLCMKHGHTFAIIDGVLRDTWQPGDRSLIFRVYRVTRAPSALLEVRCPTQRPPR